MSKFTLQKILDFFFYALQHVLTSTQKDYNDCPVQIDNFNSDKNSSRQVLRNRFKSLGVILLVYTNVI